MKHALTRSRFRSCKFRCLLQETNEDGKVADGSTLMVRMATQLTKRLRHCPFEGRVISASCRKSLGGGEKAKWIGEDASARGLARFHPS